MLAVNKITLRIGGPAGRGIMGTGLEFSKYCARLGLHVFDYSEYPSLIKGGHNTYVVRAEDEEIHSQIKPVDVLIALDEPTMTIHAGELRPESIVIYCGSLKPENTRLGECQRCPMPLKQLVKEAHGEDLMENTVALAGALGIMEAPFETFEEIIQDSFKHKGSAVVEQNVAAARKGYEYARQQYAHLNGFRLEPVEAPKRMVLTGNEAIALGAVRAGLKFYSAYPMTPASSILHWLAAWQEEHGLVVKHVEDEISAVNMAIGAGFAGVRSMCGTSGGGFALMSEGYSLAGITETPVVIVEAMRGGPGTGVPTFTEQADLRFVLSAGHGDFPRFVLAPGDVEEAFRLTIEAFDIAERYQSPVILLTDKYLSESHMSHELFAHDVVINRGKLLRNVEKGFMRYADSEDGVSPRTVPGVPNGFFLANSDEHDYFGYSTEEIPMRNLQMEKRLRKQESYAKAMPQPELFGDPDADLTLIGFGSTKMPIREAMKWLRGKGCKVNHLHLTHMSPFPERVGELIRGAKRTLIIENNITGQLAGLIREKTGVLLAERMNRYDGRPFSPEDIHDRVAAMLGGSA